MQSCISMHKQCSGFEFYNTTDSKKETSKLCPFIHSNIVWPDQEQTKRLWMKLQETLLNLLNMNEAPKTVFIYFSCCHVFTPPKRTASPPNHAVRGRRTYLFQPERETIRWSVNMVRFSCWSERSPLKIILIKTFKFSLKCWHEAFVFFYYYQLY